MINLKKKLKENKKIFASWVSIGDYQIAEIFNNIKTDFLGIDLEHSTIDLAQCQKIISSCELKGKACLPRIPTHNKEIIKRLLDAGASGIIVPNVEEVEQIKKIIEYMKYPPIGKRGYGISKAQNYGFDFDKYVDNWNKNSVLIIQIESIDAVNNIENLLNYKEVDGVLLGPYDISGSLNIPGQIDNYKVKNACKKVIKACKKYKKACGIHDTNPEFKSISSNFKLGYTFLVLGSDVFTLWRWGEKMNSYIKKINK